MRAKLLVSLRSVDLSVVHPPHRPCLCLRSTAWGPSGGEHAAYDSRRGHGLLDTTRRCGMIPPSRRGLAQHRRYYHGFPTRRRMGNGL